MKISYKKKASGFTLIEMIGVLAVIAILAALLIPKIFEAINNARINNAAVTISTVKTAIADHYAKFGSIAYDGVTKAPIATPASDFDKVLLKESFIDKPFAVKISGIVTNNVQLLAGVAATTVADGANAAFNLDGDATASDANDAGPVGSVVAVAFMKDVLSNDAWELSKRIDGDTLTPAAAGAADIIGRVKYATPANGVTDVMVYLTHR